MICIGLFKAHINLYCDLDNISVRDFFCKLSRVFLWVFSDLCDPFLFLSMCLSWAELEMFSMEILRPFWVTFWKLLWKSQGWVFVFLLKWSHFPGRWMLKSKVIQSYDNMRQSNRQSVPSWERAFWLCLWPADTNHFRWNPMPHQQMCPRIPAAP